MRRVILIYIICACAGGSLHAQQLGDFLSQARGGNSVAQYNTAMCYLHGWGTEPDTVRYHHYLRLAAEGGLKEASTALADHYSPFAPELAAYLRGGQSTLPYKYHYRSFDQGCYYGELRRGMRDGYGRFIWDDGRHLVAYWEDGEPHGMCRLSDATQTTYGHFDNFSGTGAIILAEGLQFEGIEGAVIYVGYIEEGVPSDLGAFYDAEGRNIYYGPLKDGRPSSPAATNYPYRWAHEELPEGESWEGESLDGVRHGFGIYRWADGAWWCGFWERGRREGSGLYMRADGAPMTGLWSGDVLQ